MGKKSCVYACKMHVFFWEIESDKISVHRFPKDPTEKEKWIKAIPNVILRVSEDTVVCALH